MRFDFESDTLTDNNLESIFCRDYAGICRYAHRIVNDPDDAAEIAQETFLRLQQMGQARRMAPDRVLMYRMAHNLAIDYIRRKLTRRRYAGANWPAVVVHAEKSTEDELLAREQRSQIRRALQRLSPRDIECLTLRNEGRSYDELAVLLHIHPGSVGPTVTRALRRLRRAYFDLSRAPSRLPLETADKLSGARRAECGAGINAPEA